jgi:CheY-like chemotaxis protein
MTACSETTLGASGAVCCGRGDASKTGGSRPLSPAYAVKLAASHGNRIEAQAEAAGADLFLTKPFSPLDLLRLVDRLSTQSDRADGR